MIEGNISAFAAYQKVQQAQTKKGKKNNSKKNKGVMAKAKSRIDVKKTKFNSKTNGVRPKKTQEHSRQLAESEKNRKRAKKPKDKKHNAAVLQDSATEENMEDEDEQVPMLVEVVDSAIETTVVEPEDDSWKHNSRSSARELFAWLISPAKIKSFFRDYWEKKPFWVSRKDTGYYNHLLTSQKIDDILRTNRLYYTRNVDVVSYENGKRETHNPDGQVVPCVLWDYYLQGCSVRILNPQTYVGKVHLLLASLQEYFGNMVGANVYLTPPGSQGFAPHFDDIEAFVLQLEGRKHWKLYAPKNKNDVLARFSSHNLDRSELGELLHEVTLEAGSFLYFPRGTIHEACTDSESHSLHLTVSVYQRTSYADLFEKMLPEALKKAAEEDIEFRKGLPLHYLMHAGVINTDETNTKKKMFKTVQNLMVALSKYVDVDSAVDQLGRKFMYDALPPALTSSEKSVSVAGDGERMFNGKVYNRVEFDPNTKIRLLRYFCLRLVVEDNKARIYYCTENSKTYHEEEEQFLEIDMKLVPAIRKLVDDFPTYTAIENLPLKDDDVKIQVVSDLWERGLLVTKERLVCLHEDDEDGEDESN